MKQLLLWTLVTHPSSCLQFHQIYIFFASNLLKLLCRRFMAVIKQMICFFGGIRWNTTAISVFYWKCSEQFVFLSSNDSQTSLTVDRQTLWFNCAQFGCFDSEWSGKLTLAKQWACWQLRNRSHGFFFFLFFKLRLTADRKRRALFAPRSERINCERVCRCSQPVEHADQSSFSHHTQ